MGNPVQVLASQAQRMIAENQPAQEARTLALLANDLSLPSSDSTIISASMQTATSKQAAAETNGTKSPDGATTSETTTTADISAAIQTPTALSPTNTPTIRPTPLPTSTLHPTATPTRILDAPFKLKTKQEICDGSVPPGLLQIEVTGIDRKSLPAVQIHVLWQNGEDSFYTGLAPEISPGYADFVMTPGSTYDVIVGEASTAVKGLAANDRCGLRLEFVQGNY
jgi:hypothetical protein